MNLKNEANKLEIGKTEYIQVTVKSRENSL